MDTQFLHYQVDASAGDAIIVKLDKQANVRVMDSTNFSRYRRGERHQYLGGRALTRPTRIPLPRPGHWHVVVDLGGIAESVKASVALDHAGSHAI